MLVPVLRRSLAWIVAGGLLVGCAAPTADWKPLWAQDGSQRGRDWQSCQPTYSPWTQVALVLLAPHTLGSAGVGETIATHRCMERAGYEWVGRSPRE